jgi:glucose-6-phosphate-specific signal transduction histidine kinase
MSGAYLSAEPWQWRKALASILLGVVGIAVATAGNGFGVLGIATAVLVIAAAITSRFWHCYDSLTGWRRALVHSIAGIGTLISILGLLAWLVSLAAGRR